MNQPYIDPSTLPPSPLAPVGPPPKKSRAKWIIPLIFCVGPLVLIVLIAAIASSGTKTTTTAATPTTAAPAATVTIAPVAEAPTTAAPTTVAPTTEPPTTMAPTTTAPAPPPAPAETAGQRNARKSAQHYLDTMAFSRLGLIKQLESPYGSQFSHEDAVYGVDSLNADWNEQAVKSAKHYLDTMAFSRDGLIRQLESPYGAQFTHEEAVYGVNGAGL